MSEAVVLENEGKVRRRRGVSRHQQREGRKRRSSGWRWGMASLVYSIWETGVREGASVVAVFGVGSTGFAGWRLAGDWLA